MIIVRMKEFQLFAKKKGKIIWIIESYRWEILFRKLNIYHSSNHKKIKNVRLCGL